MAEKPLNKLLWSVLGVVLAATLVGTGSVLWGLEPRIAVLERADSDNQKFQTRVLDMLEDIRTRLPPYNNE